MNSSGDFSSGDEGDRRPNHHHQQNPTGTAAGAALHAEKDPLDDSGSDGDDVGPAVVGGALMPSFGGAHHYPQQHRDDDGHDDDEEEDQFEDSARDVHSGHHQQQQPPAAAAVDPSYSDASSSDGESEAAAVPQQQHQQSPQRFNPFAVDFAPPPSAAGTYERNADGNFDFDDAPPIISRALMADLKNSSGSHHPNPFASSLPQQQQKTHADPEVEDISALIGGDDADADVVDAEAEAAAAAAAAEAAEAEAKAARDRQFQQEVERRVQEQLRKQEERRQREEEQRLAEEAARMEAERLAMEEAGAQREAELRRIAAEEEARRVAAEAEAARIAAAEAEAEAQRQREAEEIERRVQEQIRRQEEQRLAEEAAVKAKADAEAAEALRLQQAEARRVAEEAARAEAERLAMEEAAAQREAELRRIAAEEEARKVAAAAEAARIAAAEAEALAQRQREAEEIERRVQEQIRRQEEQRLAEEAAAKARAEAEAEAEEARRAAAEAEAEAEAQRQQQQHEAEARRIAAEEAAHAAALTQQREAEAARAAAEAEAARIAAAEAEAEAQRQREAEEIERRVQEQIRRQEEQRLAEEAAVKAKREAEAAEALRLQQERERAAAAEAAMQQEIERRIARETEARVQAALAKANAEREAEAAAMAAAAEAQRAEAEAAIARLAAEKRAAEERLLSAEASLSSPPPQQHGGDEFGSGMLSPSKDEERARRKAEKAAAKAAKAKAEEEAAAEAARVAKEAAEAKARAEAEAAAAAAAAATAAALERNGQKKLSGTLLSRKSKKTTKDVTPPLSDVNSSSASSSATSDSDSDDKSSDSGDSMVKRGETTPSFHSSASSSRSNSSSNATTDDDDTEEDSDGAQLAHRSSSKNKRAKAKKAKGAAQQKKDEKKKGKKSDKEDASEASQKGGNTSGLPPMGKSSSGGNSHSRRHVVTISTSPTPSQRRRDGGGAPRSGSSNFGGSPLLGNGNGPDGINDTAFYQHGNGLFDGPSDAVNAADIERAKIGIAAAVDVTRAEAAAAAAAAPSAPAASSGSNSKQQAPAAAAASAPLPNVLSNGPNFRDFELEMARQQGFATADVSAAAAAAEQVVIENFPTIREEGRCPDAAPGAFEGAEAANAEALLPYNSFMALQNNFFKAQQFVVGLPGGSFSAERFPQIPDREPTFDVMASAAHAACEPNAKSFSAFTPIYESSLVKKDVVESDDDEADDVAGGAASDLSDHSSDDDISDDDELEARRAERRRVAKAEREAKKARRPFAENPIADPSDPTVVSRIGSSYLFPDPLHMWERARGKRLVGPPGMTSAPKGGPTFDPAKGSGSTGSQAHTASLVRSTFSTTYGPNTHRVYCNEQLDINAFRRPLPAVSMFNNGFLLRISVDSIFSSLEKEHGAVDPLMLTFSLYTVPTAVAGAAAPSRKKISEDFHVGVHLDQFFPHKSLHVYNNLRTFVIFVPEEHRVEPLALICRVNRLSSDDFANYVDLYQRPQTYQRQKHLVPMLQETQQLAMNAVAWQELGFTFFRIAGCELKATAGGSADKIYRSTKALRPEELLDLIYSENKLKGLSTVPLTVAVSVSDASFNEASFPAGLVEAARSLELSPTDTANSAALASQISLKLPHGATPIPQETESLLWLRDPEDVKGKKDLCRHVGTPRHVLGGGYVNAFYSLYYLRILSVRLATVPSAVRLPSTHRAIVIQVALKANDDSWSEEGVPALYGGPLGSGLLTTSACTTTTHSSFSLDLADEFKIQLPPYITRKHHLFFTFWAVATKKLPPPTASAPQPPRMMKLGYAFSPLVAEEGAALAVRDVFDLPMITPDAASAIGAGYLFKVQEGTVKEHAVLGGAPVITLGASTRTSMYSADATMGSFCEKMKLTIPHIVNDTGALRVSGRLPPAAAETDQLFESQLRMSTSLGKVDIVAYFPALCSFHIACIASPNEAVSIAARRQALQGLMHIVHTMHDYDMNDNTYVQYRRVGTSPKGPVRVASSQMAARTAVANTLYTFLGNNPMFTEQRFAVAHGVAEVWLDVITDLSAKATTRTAEEQQFYARLSDYSWFLLDLMLRSLYLSSAIAPTSASPPGAAAAARINAANNNNSSIYNNNGGGETPRGSAVSHSRTQSATPQPQYVTASPIDPSFYRVLEKLLIAVLKKEIPVLGTVIIGRVAIFLRQATVRCDRGSILHMATRVFASIRSVPANVQCALRIFTEHSDAYRMMAPAAEDSPTAAGYFMATFLDLLKPSLLHRHRDVRFGAAGAIYNLCVRLVNNKRASGADVRRVATSMYGLVVFMSQHWKDFAARTNEPSPSATGGGASPVAAKGSAPAVQQQQQAVMDRRMVLSIVAWIIFHGGMASLRGFLQTVGTEDNRPLLAGFFHMLVDMQNSFRYQSTHAKSEVRVMDDLVADAALWDSRFATFVHFIGAAAAAEALSQCASVRLVDQRTAQNPQIYPFFLLLESVVSVNNSSVSLIAGSSALHQTSHRLFPELISGRASYMSGMILLAMRLMSFSTPAARRNAVKIVTEMATLYHTMTGNMSRMRSNMANALVGVAESKGRDMTKAGIFILNGLQSVSTSLRAIEGTPAADIAPDGFMARFVDGGNTQSSNSGMRYDYHVPSLPTTDDWIRTKQVADSVLQQQLRACAGSLSEEFGHMIDSLVQLFKSVLRVQQDDAMQYKESKCSAYHQIIASFFNQCVVTQGFKWLQRLHDAHRGNEDNVEAALASVVSAALAFRITEIFYEVKGRETQGARMPFAIFSHVSYSEYLHIVPELAQILPTPAVYAMVTELTTVGAEPVFTVEGQIVILQAAAGLLDKANYAELSLSVALLAAKFAVAKGDYAAGAASYAASSKLCDAIASTNVRRAQHKFFLVWARMEMEQPPIKVKKSRRSILAAEEKEKEKERQKEAERAALQLASSGTFSATQSGANGGGDDVYTVRKPLFLSEPIKKVVKVPFNTDQRAFEKQIYQQIASLLEDPSIVIMTEDSADTLPFAKPKRKKGVAPGIPLPAAVSSAANPGLGSPSQPLLSPRLAHPSAASPKGALASPAGAPPTAPAGASGVGAAAAAAAAAGLSLNHCWLTVKEVTPYLTPDEVNLLRPHQRTCNAIDKTTFISRFECTSLCGLGSITRVSEGLAGSLKATKVVSHFDPMAIKKEHHIFSLARSFPSSTTSIDVVDTTTTCLDAAETAADLIRKQTAELTADTALAGSGSSAPSPRGGSSASKAGVNLISRIHEALTPLGIVPAGNYYKQLAASMRSEPEVMQALTAFIMVAKKRTDEALTSGQAMERYPEKCANVLKAVADMECALL